MTIRVAKGEAHVDFAVPAAEIPEPLAAQGNRPAWYSPVLVAYGDVMLWADGKMLTGLDAATGKFYLQPGTDAHPVRLNGLAVEAPTELRRGDRLQVGVHEFEFLA